MIQQYLFSHFNAAMNYCKKWGAVVFDLDDTLYPEHQYVHSGFVAVARYLEDRLICSGADFYSVAKKVFAEGTRGRIFDESLIRIGVVQSSEEIRDLVNVYRQHEPVISLYPDAAGCLEGLSGRFELGMITDGPSIGQRRKVDALDLKKWIKHFIYSDDKGFSFWKPHPMPYLDIQTKLNIESRCIVYVGDNPAKDFLGARRVGWDSIRIKRKGTIHFDTEPAAGYEPDFEFESLSDLVKWLEK